MRIHSVTVRNYRVHQDITVELDPSRTVVGGLNESGKSTLIEAAHRALFMRYKTGGSSQAEMQSNHGGHPAVEVVFEIAGIVYKIAKQFRTNGSAVLTQDSGPTLKNDEAEVWLAELLGVTPPSGKSGSRQWAHLWVWQGQAFDDPMSTANAQLNPLIEQFQHSGVVIATQSVLDGRVASRFEDMMENLYTKTGAPKKGSEPKLPLAANCT